MKCGMFPNKPCDLLTCHRKKHCLWTEEEIKEAHKTPLLSIVTRKGLEITMPSREDSWDGDDSQTE